MIEIPVKPFFMLRHGESEANAAGVYSGQVDTPLTLLGREQAGAVSETLSSLLAPPGVVVHSHLSRARDTAKLACAALDVDFFEHPEWAEHYLGDWQMRPHEDIKKDRLNGIDPPGGETNAEFSARIALAARDSLTRYERPLIVCHGGCFRALSENYGLCVRGTRNAVLYEYIPSTQDKAFPWDVYYHDPEQAGRFKAEEYS